MTEEFAITDKIDREILRMLSTKGRISYLELARRVHLSPNAVAQRVRKLEKTGVITGFRAEIDQTKLGRALIVYVDFRVRPGTDSLRFEKALEDIDGVIGFSAVTGAYDYQVKFACVDQDDLYKKLVKLRLQPGVEESHTRLILNEARFSS